MFLQQHQAVREEECSFTQFVVLYSPKSHKYVSCYELPLTFWGQTPAPCQGSLQIFASLVVPNKLRENKLLRF